MASRLSALLPVRKVTASGVGAFTAQLGIYYIATYYPTYALTPDQQTLATVGCTMLAGWLIKSKDTGRHAKLPKQRVNQDQGVTEPRALTVGSPE